MKKIIAGSVIPKRNKFAEFLVRRRGVIVEVVAALFILLFVYTAINKFLAINDLKYVLKEYPLIGDIGEFVAWALPVTELIVAILLFLPRSKLLGLYTSLILMSGFTFYLGYMLLFTPKLPCTCGGMLQKLSWPQHFFFNLFFILLAVTAIWIYKKRPRQIDEMETTSIVFT